MEHAAAVDAAVAAARTALGAWSGRPLPERLALLTRWRRTLARHADELAALAQREVGKPPQDGVNEVLHACNGLRWLVRNAPRVLRPERVSAWPLLHCTARVERRPFGVVAAIAPWNYPIVLAAGPVAGALAAGCAIVLKPSEHAAGTARLLGELWRAAGGLDNAFVVLPGGPDTALALAGHPGIAKVFFTGGAAGGRAALAAAARHLTPVVLELGGCDAAVVLPDADLERTARGLAWGAFLNAGQSCVAVRRCFAVGALAEPLAAAVARQAAALRHGPRPNGAAYELPPLRSAAQAEHARALVADAVALGAGVLQAGLPPDADPRAFPPTVLANVPPAARALREECFAPLLAVCPVADAGEAVRLANAAPFGLGASVWTRDVRHAEAIVRQLRVGGATINDGLLHFAAAGAPFGGRGASGFGRAQGREGLLEFAAATTVVRNRWPGWADFHWFPYGRRERFFRRVLRWLHG